MSTGRPEPRGVPAVTSLSASRRVDINDLSNEIVLQIIRWVGSDSAGTSDPRNLLSLALCSRRFHTLTEPVLYSEFTEHIHSSKSDKNFLCFLRRILASPHLAQCLKEFRGVAHSNDIDSLLPVASELTDPDWTRLRTAIHGASTFDDEAATWIQAVEKGEWNALCALLLSLTPNIEELALSNWAHPDDDYTYLHRFLDKATKLQDLAKGSPFALSKLRNISVEYWDTELGFEFDVLKPFLKLKSVEVFHGHMLSEDSFLEEDADPRLKKPSLALMTKDLTFTYSVISHHDMVLILRCFPQLESFHYDFGGALVGYADFEPPRMMAALEHLKHCLRYLTLISDQWAGMSDMELYPIGSLADFQRLVSITANASIMIGEDHSDTQHLDSDDSAREIFPRTQNLVDAVPPTLEFLSLTECSEYVVRHIFELVSQKKSKTPLLRKVDLGWEGVKYPDKDSLREPTIHPGFSKEEVNKLMVACEAAGVEIVINYQPPRPKFVSFDKPGETLDEKSVALGFRPIPVTVLKYFPYPYDGYEEYCEENNCDPETGRLKVA